MPYTVYIRVPRSKEKTAGSYVAKIEKTHYQMR